MAYSAYVIADSVSEAGVRLTTMEVTLPRIVLAEFNTHRMFSRNSASSRAIPVAKQLAKIKEDPFIPVHFGANQAGMQANAELEGEAREAAKAEWLAARDSAVEHVEHLLEIGLHKQITNRILEPWMWQTILVTATEWSNFYALRANPQAQPEIRIAAELMLAAMNASMPELKREGEWHLPLIGYIPTRDRFESEQEWLDANREAGAELQWAKSNPDDAIKVSVGRCARVSYLTHDGVRDHSKDIELYERLVGSGHMSPTEHVATPLYKPGALWLDGHGTRSNYPEWSGNFRGWKQFRKTLPSESDYSEILAASTAA
jgi:thymidylate synthase ThyX